MTRAGHDPKRATTDDQLWTARELATFLGYSESTVTRMVSQEPNKLPPRVLTLARPRWLPSVVLSWVKENTGPVQIGGQRRIAPPTKIVMAD